MTGRVSDERLREFLSTAGWDEDTVEWNDALVIAAELLDARDRIARAVEELGAPLVAVGDSGRLSLAKRRILAARAILTGDRP